MFRTTFQTMDETVDDVVYESCNVVQAPKVFEGRVGRFGKVQRVSAPVRKSCCQEEAELMDSKYAPCLHGVTHDESGTQPAIFLDAQVLRDFAAVEWRATANDRSSSKDDADETCSVSSSQSSRSDCSDLSSASDASIADINALQRDKKPWEEPLLAVHHKVEVDARAAKAAKLEAERVALQERYEAARLQQEMRDLANCVDLSPNRYKKNRIQRVLSKTGVTAVCRFLKNPFRLFKGHKIHNGYAPRKGVHAVVTPRRAFNEVAPHSHALAQMRSVAPPRKARSEMQFATVNSTQRDVAPWTVEEYMKRNGRNGDEEFGGIEGNNLMNWTSAGGMHITNYDSDSD